MLALGRLDDADLAEAEEHVAGCAECARSIAETPGDSFTALLQAAQSSSDTSLPSAEAVTLATPLPVGKSDLTAVWPTADQSTASTLPPALAAHPRYRPVRPLGHGGMGAVWLAEHKLMGRLVAVKVIRPEMLTRPEASARFQREANSAARLHHPNIVTAFDFEQCGETYLLAMEYIDGASLAEELRQRGPFPVAEACACIQQAALGLRHAHEKGLVHRDLKPQNLMRARDGSVKILDFGLAVLHNADASTGLTGAHMVVGTPDYIAPEQAEDSHTADFRSDIYSLGCTFYLLLTGVVPFPGNSVLRKLDAHREHEPVPIRKLRPEVSQELAAVVSKMMAKQPGDRYQSAAAVAQAVGQTFLSAGKVHEGRQECLPHKRRWRPLIAAVAALLFAGFIAAAGIFYVVTDTGTIEIRTDDPAIKVIAEQNGQKITLHDAKNQQSWVVDTGKWTVRLDGNPEGLTLDMPHTFTLRRGDKQVVTVKRIKVPDIVGRPPEAEKVGEVRRFGDYAPGTWVTNTLFSRDGQLVLASCGDVRVWDTRTGKEVRRFNEGVFGWGLALSPDGKRVFSSTDDGLLRVFDLGTGKESKRFQGHTDRADAVAVSPDGKHALTTSVDNTTRLWDVEKGTQIRKHEFRSNFIFCPDGKHYVTSAVKSLRKLEVATGKEVLRIDEPTGFNWGPAVSPDGCWVAAGSSDSLVRMWDLNSGKQVRTFKGHGPNAPARLAFSPDGKRLLSAGNEDKTVRLWDVNTGAELACFEGHTSSVVAANFSPDGHYAVSCAFDGTVRLWRLPEPPVEKVGEVRRFEGHAPGLLSVQFSPDGRQAVSGSGHWDAAAEKDFSVRLWDVASGKELRRFEGHTAMVRTVAYSGGGRRVLSGSLDGTARLWDVESGKELQKLIGGAKGVHGVALARDGTRVLAVGPDSPIRLFDTDSGRELHLLSGHPNGENCVVFSPDERYALSCGSDLRLWRLPGANEK